MLKKSCAAACADFDFLISKNISYDLIIYSVSSKALFLVSDLLAILGFLLVVLATVELGRSIGISPANRGHVRSGIYRYIKHPMYAGYILSEIGLSLINPFNAILLLVSTTLYYFRAKAEEKQFQINDI